MLGRVEGTRAVIGLGVQDLLDGALSKDRRDPCVKVLGQTSGNLLRVLLDKVEGVVKSSTGEVMGEDRVDLGHVLLGCVDDCIWAGVKGISGLDAILVVLCDNADDGAGDVIHVEDRGVGVEANGVELVGILHGQLCKLGEVLGVDGGDHVVHALGNDVLDTVLKES